MTTIRIETDNYNDRRYGKPWIARVDFAANKKGDYAWGDWIGSAGSEGMLEIDAEPGDIIAQGQKDFRKPKNSAPEFFVVNPDGSLDEIGDKGAAYKYYIDTVDAAPDNNKLIAEKEALLARIAEIDAIINA